MAWSGMCDVREDPVIPAGENGSWNKSKWPHTVLRINDTLKMWYTASSNNFNTNYRIGYAWSVEEHTWNLDTVPTLGLGEPGTWDDFGNYAPLVHFDGSIYHMWYNGFHGLSLNDPDEIGYATSQDGINWDKDTLNSPVLTIEESTFYSKWIQGGTILIQDTTYHMWFIGHEGQLRKYGYAISTDGINWEVQNEQQPVLIPGPELWDNYDIFFPSVLWHDGQYKMWYTGYCSGCDYKVGYATDLTTGSTDVSTLSDSQFEVFPNPCRDKLSLSILLRELTYVKIALYNLHGVRVATIYNGSLNEGNNEMEFETSWLHQGTYFCILKTNSGYPNQMKKIIKL
jgi:predicted GH43/DUF377 family glycosyl hydrolase